MRLPYAPSVDSFSAFGPVSAFDEARATLTFVNSPQLYPNNTLGWQWIEHLPYGPTGRAAVAILRRSDRK